MTQNVPRVIRSRRHSPGALAVGCLAKSLPAAPSSRLRHYMGLFHLNHHHQSPPFDDGTAVSDNATDHVTQSS